MFASAIVAIAGAACGGGGKAVATSTPEANASTLLQQMLDGINTGDTAATMALFADDAVSEGGPRCAAAPCVGRTSIQPDIEFYVSEHVGFDGCSNESSGDMATATCELRTNGTRRNGIDRFIGALTVKARGGKLTSFRWGAINIADKLTATYFGAAGPAVYDVYLDAMNRGDVDAVMALFADDAVLEGADGCPDALCTGKDAIRHVIERQVAAKIKLTSTRPELFDPFGTFSRITDVLEVTEGSGVTTPPTASIELKLKRPNIESIRFAVN